MEIDAKVAELIKQASDPSKSLAPLHDMADNEFRRLGELLGTPNAPAGTIPALFEATVSVIGDWSDFEVAALEGMEAAQHGAKKPATSAPVRTGQRRGMRI
jgi:hypothetical protein